MKMIALTIVLTLLIGTAFTENRQPELAFVSLRVSNLVRSIVYYRALGFTVSGSVNPRWTRDEAANRLYNTPGIMSRTATLNIANTGSAKPFTLYLREFKDLPGGDRVDFPARDPSASHIGVIVPDADTLWTQLKTAGQLRALSWDAKLVRMPGQTSGGIAYVMDPDGFNIEIMGMRPGAAAKASGQAPMPDHSSLSHFGLVVLDSAKAKSFYGGLLGAKFPDTTPQWRSGDNYDAAVGGRGYVFRPINGTFPAESASETGMRLELIEYQKPNRNEVADYRYSDIAVSCVGFEVEGLDALFSRLKDAGIKAWSQGGIVRMKDGTRAVVVRDPDVGAFVELFEQSKK